MTKQLEHERTTLKCSCNLNGLLNVNKIYAKQTKTKNNSNALLDFKVICYIYHIVYILDVKLLIQMEIWHQASMLFIVGEPLENLYSCCTGLKNRLGEKTNFIMMLKRLEKCVGSETCLDLSTNYVDLKTKKRSNYQGQFHFR